ncbi:peptidoglycan-binding protein [Streptomyces sp. NPDC091266]|uniref:peptidoglycan-binding domain-containing protein n=1 Tax=Streptomyces sp. NPDC091266 TaxID=3365978 RepID=UPI0038046DA7
MTAPTCPHCFAPVRGDGRPTCLCAAAGEEDFDPLHIRPYVSLPEGTDTYEGADAYQGSDTYQGADTYEGSGTYEAGEPGEAGGGAGGAGPATAPGAGSLPGRLSEGPPPGAEASDLPLFPAPRHAGPTSRTFTSSDTPFGLPSGTSSAASSGAESFAPAAASPAPAPPASPAPAASPRRRKRALPATLAAVAAAVAAASVLIGSEALSGGERERAAPPDRGTVAPTAAFPTGGPTGPTGSGTPSGPAAPRAPSASSEASAGPLPGSSADPDASSAPHPAPTRADGSVTHAPGEVGATAPATGPIVLREGSSGPEVTELQGRLRQLALYAGVGNSGRYDAGVRDAVARFQEVYGVEGDGEGVYGAATRASLESRTSEP